MQNWLPKFAYGTTLNGIYHVILFLSLSSLFNYVGLEIAQMAKLRTHLLFWIVKMLISLVMRNPVFGGLRPGVDFTKGFKTWHKFSTEISFMLIPIIVLFIAHEFITRKF